MTDDRHESSATTTATHTGGSHQHQSPLERTIPCSSSSGSQRSTSARRERQIRDAAAHRLRAGALVRSRLGGRSSDSAVRVAGRDLGPGCPRPADDDRAGAPSPRVPPRDPWPTS